MKRFLSLCVALLTSICLWAGNVITYTATEKLLETTDGYSHGLHTNAFGDASISDHTFSNGTGTITFNEDITQIGYCAFRDCGSLTSITIPSSVTLIDYYAFDGCSGLTNISIPSSVTSIGAYAFRGCDGLTQAEFASLESLCKISFNGGAANPLTCAHHLFIEGKEVTSVIIPSSVTSIGSDAFNGCSYLTSVTIPSSVTSIGKFAFNDCSGLTSVSISSSVTSIGSSAFSGCSGLTSVTIPSSVMSIGSGAFSGCSGLTKAEFGSLESLCKITFNGVAANPLTYAHHLFIEGKEVTNVIIPSSVTSIGSGAFSGCSGLTSVTIPSSVTSIGSSAFSGCSGLTSINIPSSVTSIDSYVFDQCSGLTSITIPSSVTIIYYSAFGNCKNLQNVHISWNDPIKISSTVFKNTPINSVALHVPNGTFAKYAAADVWKEFLITSGDVITYKATSKLTQTPYSTSSGLYIDAFGDARISNHTFSDGIGTITFNKSITQIGSYAFYKCSGLTSISIPSSVTIIGPYAFQDCNSLTSINIPSSVTEIDQRAFRYCSSLTSVSIPSSVTNIYSYAFDGCSGLTRVEFSSLESFLSIHYSDPTSNPLRYAKNLYINGKEIKEIIIPKSITSFSRYAFSGYSGILAVPLSLKSIATYAGISNDKLFVYDDFSNNAISYIKGFKCFEPTPNPDLIFTNIKPYITFNNIKFFLADGNELPYTKNEDGGYLVKGLHLGSKNQIKVTYTDGEGNNQSCEFNITTKYPTFSITTSVTQSTVTVETVTPESDITCTPTNPGIEYGVKYNSFPAVIDGLYPEKNVRLYAFAYYDGELYEGFYKDVKTSEIAPTVRSRANITASSLEVSGYYTHGDATITNEQLEVNGKTYKGNEIIVTGLDPKTEYTVTYSLTANGMHYSGSRVFTTAALSMKTMQPKVINVGNVIVGAESNLDDDETNVGFEWRRTDWTSDFASNTGGAYMYNGQMEGYIRNLNTEKLWKYRPYYLSNSGTYYYGDWVGVDPTNTSYFEATVHTYDKIEVEGNTALVKGYALRGTDPIKVQGFVYWKKVAGAKAMDGRMYAAAVPSNAKTVEANGQIMNATLANLDYDSEYTYIAFVTTTEGETFYGEERTFKTEADTSGINDVMSDNASSEPATVMGYYDLNGRRIQNPERGIYIIRYSDGSSRKFMKK